uniref:Islet amyloid polypeptide n=2 Tax=Pseudocrenilabrinae TaxID=318546 RepID=A0A3Q4I1T7_NEOBR
MYHLRVPVLLLMLLVLLHCITASRGAGELCEAWLLPGLISNPFLSLVGTRPRRGLTAMNSHHIEKRKCNTATCVTQRLADFLVRSSNTIGTVYAPTNVGSATYGKRDLLEPSGYVNL